MIRRAVVTLVLLVNVSAAPQPAERCAVLRDERFNGTGEHVLLTGSDAAPVALFRAPLAVNTDGAPTSYHPVDYLGLTKAVNRYDNGITIRTSAGVRVKRPLRDRIFEQWRDSGGRCRQAIRSVGKT